MKVTMSTGTGHISSKIIPQLLDAGAEVTVISRNPHKLAELRQRGVKVVEGSLEDRDTVIRATQGADVLFWMTPPDFTADDVIGQQLDLAGNAAAAIRENKIKRVVNLSSLGAEQRSGIGIVSGLGQVEDVLEQTDASITHVRPTFFMENFENQIPTMLGEGRVYMAFDGDKPVPQIATADIADVMAQRILDEKWNGKQVHELHGHADLSFREATSQIGKELGRELEYVQITPEQQTEAMQSMGASPSFASNYTELMTGIDSGRSSRLDKRTAASTTPTPFGHYLKHRLIPAMQSMQQQATTQQQG